MDKKNNHAKENHCEIAEHPGQTKDSKNLQKEKQ